MRVATEYFSSLNHFVMCTVDVECDFCVVLHAANHSGRLMGPENFTNVPLPPSPRLPSPASPT